MLLLILTEEDVEDVEDAALLVVALDVTVVKVAWLLLLGVVVEEEVERPEDAAEDAAEDAELEGALFEALEDDDGLGDELKVELVKVVVVLATLRATPGTVPLELLELELELIGELETLVLVLARELELELDLALELTTMALLPEPPDNPFPPEFNPLPPRPLELPVPVALSSVLSVPSST